MDQFSSSGKGVMELPTLLCTLERANLNHCTRQVDTPSPCKTETDSLPVTMFSSYLECLMMDRVHKCSDSECYMPSLEPFKLNSNHTARYHILEDSNTLGCCYECLNSDIFVLDDSFVEK
jgi:hypothetical protein